MSDIQSTGPDYQNLVELQPKVQEERRLDSFPKLSFPVGTLVVETGGRIDYVLTAGGLIDERKELKEEINLEVKQKEVLRKIYQNLGKNNPELKQAIENQTIKIFEVPNRDLVALSVEGKNVDYLYDLDGKIYGNFKEGRKILDDYIRLLGFSSSGNFREKLLLNGENYNLNDGNYDSNKITFILLGVNGEELEQFSNNSLKRYSEWADHLKTLNKRLDEILSEWQE